VAAASLMGGVGLHVAAAGPTTEAPPPHTLADVNAHAAIANGLAVSGGGVTSREPMRW